MDIDLNKMVNQLVKRGSVVLLLTFLATSASVLIIDDVGFYFSVSLLLSVFLQVVLLRYKKVYSAVIPFEKMTERMSDVLSIHYKKVIALLIITPIISVLSIWLGLLWVLLAYAFVGKPLFKIAMRIKDKNSIQDLNKKQFIEDKPEVVVYMSGLKNVAYQINQWIPVLEKLSNNVAILVRERSVVEGMQPTEIPVYFARTQFEVEYALATAGCVKTVLYPANTMKNVQALRHYKLNHYFINHGESDKAVNQSKLLMAYDKLLVGGPLAERRLREVGLPLRDNQIEYVGRPQAEVLLDKKTERDNEIKTILYAPTWEGFVEDVNYSSISKLGFSALESLLEGGEFDIIFKPHPYTGVRSKESRYWLSRINELCSGNDNVKIYDKMMPIHDAMNECDLLITDVSSVLNEFLVTDKPIILCNAKESSIGELAKDFPSSQAAYVLNGNEDSNALVKSIINEDSLGSKRKEVRQDSLSDFPEGALNRFNAIVSRSASS